LLSFLIAHGLGRDLDSVREEIGSWLEILRTRVRQQMRPPASSIPETRCQMSVIDRVLQGTPTESPTPTLREAAVTVLVAAAAADGTLAPAELARLNALLSSMRLYRQVPPEHLHHLIESALELTMRMPPEGLLAACAAVIPAELRASIFALAVELVFVDGTIAEREKRFVDALQSALAVDDETAVKIVEVLLIKTRA
jgi:uncharacterized tellurite resistance protein B-like protein